MKVKISFIILNYNQSNTIKDTIYSIVYSKLSNQQIEIIIIDDYTNEYEINSLLNIINDINERYDIKIHLFRHNFNLKNKSKSRNLGIKNSNGDFICFLNGNEFVNSVELLNVYETISKDYKDIYFTPKLSINKSKCKKTSIDIKSLEYNDYYASNYIVKKSFLIDNHIFFDEKTYKFISEDLFFFCKILDNIKNSTTYDIVNIKWFCCKNNNYNNKCHIIDQSYWNEYKKFLEQNILNKHIIEYGQQVCDKFIMNIEITK